MNLSLVFLILIPVIGGMISSLAGKTEQRRHRVFRLSALFADLVCLLVMAAVIYRRFYIPLGASQLTVDWGDWFSVPPLTADFSLRMDTASGVISLAAILAATALQFRAARRRADARVRGAQNLLLASMLLFILADNLIPVLAALFASGPLLVMGAVRSWEGSEGSDKTLQNLILHAFADALAILGLFLVFDALGTLSYEQIAREVSVMPSPRLESASGVILLLLGVGLRSGPGGLNALAPLLAAAYLAYRLKPLVLTAPRVVLILAGAAVTITAIANFAFSIFESKRTQERFFRLANRFHDSAQGFFDDFLEGAVHRRFFPWLFRRPEVMGARFADAARTRQGAGALAGAFFIVFVLSLYFAWPR